MRSSRIVSIGTALAVFLLVGSAFAAGVQDLKTAAKDGDQGYGYKFDDDPLAAGGFGPNDATIRVRPGPVRTTLIRPRVSFVDNMLKSVENL